MSLTSRQHQKTISVAMAGNRGDSMSELVVGKPFVYVDLILHGNKEVSFSDYIDDNNKFIPQGVQTVAALKRHEQIYFNAGAIEGGRFEGIIPYHAVDQYTVTKRTEQYDYPEDAFCTENVCPTSPNCGGNKGSRTRVFPDGEYGFDISALWLTLEDEFSYLKQQGISITFMGEEVISGEGHSEGREGDNTFTIVTTSGSHLLTFDYEMANGYKNAKVDGEYIGSTIEFVIGTSEYYVAFNNAHDNQMMEQALYPLGAIPVFATEPGAFDYYYDMFNELESDIMPIPDDNKYPAVIGDSYYNLDKN